MNELSSFTPWPPSPSEKNSISQILNEQGAWIQDHEGKAGLLWNSFKNRLGGNFRHQNAL